MVKFKIRAKKDCQHKGYVRGDVFDVIKQTEEEYRFLDRAYRLRYRPKEEFDIVEEKSPIRTVTRKEIVPGRYGNIHIDKGGLVTMIATNKAANMRESAHILNQIAEALEDGTTF